MLNMNPTNNNINNNQSFIYELYIRQFAQLMLSLFFIFSYRLTSKLYSGYYNICRIHFLFSIESSLL